MKTIDVHTHLLPPTLPDWAERFGKRGFIQLKPCGHGSRQAKMVRDDGTEFRTVESNLWDPKRRLLECDSTHVGQQVLSTVPVMFHYGLPAEYAHETSRFLNDHLAQVVSENPTRFFGLGTLPMQDSKRAIAELLRCKRELKLSGVQIGTHISAEAGAFNLCDPPAFEVLQACAQEGMSVFVHPWDMMGQERMQKYWLPWLVGMPAELSLALCSVILGGVLERLPSLRIAFAHGGGAFAGTLGRIEHGYRARPDLCAVDCPKPPREYLSQIYVDSLVHDQAAFDLILNTFGSKRILVGSDYPFPLGEAHPGALVSEQLASQPSALDDIRSRNALRWLGH